MTKRLSDGLSNAELPIFEGLNARNGRWFDVEIEKLERWTGDRRDRLKVSLEELDARIKETGEPRAALHAALAAFVTCPRHRHISVICR